MRIGVYGGSFNPPHVGHAMVASWLRWTRRVDEVWFVPTFAHAFGKPLAPYDVRAEMCAALADELGDWARVSDVERSLGGTSWTIRTLDALAERSPGAAFHLVIGADVAAQTALWRSWDRIAARYTPIVVGRSGCPPVPDSPDFPDVSSTDIRARLARGEDVRHLVPACVLTILVREGTAVFAADEPPA